ncbi:hypothetical protein UFOVP232_75 [uncultured Caudovirales phage]|uniref:Uncharacterized protein n=1 Tax=uncultured Caudovirales phage TaxID=2100421 RepID=A0A6J7WQ84_9CAUD|nr:hypothetical protein UFOVP232_75 [uncultured Caudovirales phage]
MRTAASKKIRELLRANPDGLTIQEVNAVVQMESHNLRHTLRDMPDTYIDRWVERPRQALAAVWCAVVPPENCPRPTKKRSK